MFLDALDVMLMRVYVRPPPFWLELVVVKSSRLRELTSPRSRLAYPTAMHNAWILRAQANDHLITTLVILSPPGDR